MLEDRIEPTLSSADAVGYCPNQPLGPAGVDNPEQDGLLKLIEKFLSGGLLLQLDEIDAGLPLLGDQYRDFNVSPNLAAVLPGELPVSQTIASIILQAIVIDFLIVDEGVGLLVNFVASL